MAAIARPPFAADPRPSRPAVVEPVDFPPSTSDGRAANRPAPGRRALASQIGRFAAIGVASTLAWAALYSLLRAAGLGEVAANGLALVTTAIANTAANRRLTFGVTGRTSLARDHGAGLLAFALALALTSGTAAGLDRFLPHAGRLIELAALAASNLVATVGRFAVLRSWLGRASPLTG